MVNKLANATPESVVKFVRVNLRHYLSCSGFDGPGLESTIDQILAQCDCLDRRLDSDGSRYFRQAMSLAVGKVTEPTMRYQGTLPHAVPPECQRTMEPCEPTETIWFFRARWWLEFLGFAEPRTVRADQVA
ncbi:hypothetical protein Q31b_29060 [Novipirellula aureliae]|uniref:Uncharacterized protein n=1 Tax=Novipirellula aureliae TaxID=2527966 RepID=A0A5C6E2T5_9BACT|nr:hypothetical protein [Novipirellula aureliae]TWU41459.1 hypothetical protein Q31b_29060 [Novipirellula aureliae]